MHVSFLHAIYSNPSLLFIQYFILLFLPGEAFLQGITCNHSARHWKNKSQARDRCLPAELFAAPGKSNRPRRQKHAPSGIWLHGKPDRAPFLEKKEDQTVIGGCLGPWSGCRPAEKLFSLFAASEAGVCR